MAEDKNVQIFTTVSTSLLAEIRALAARDNRSVSGYIRNLLAREAAKASRRNGR